LRGLVFVGLLGGLAILLSGCEVFSSPQNTFSPAGEVAADQKKWFLWSMWPALAIMLFVELGILFIIFKFRERPGHSDLPKQTHGNNALEISWTLAPALLLLAFVPVVVYGIVKLGDTPDDAIQVEVNAFRFGWFFGYTASDGSLVEGDPTTPSGGGDPLVVPVGETIGVRLHSSDVIHSFWVPRLAGKTDVMPGRTNHMWFKADEVGTFSAQCAEFCGLSHGEMRFQVKVVTRSEYDAYVQGLVAARDGLQEDGDLVAADEGGRD
jgi:cytochrome c oxidase subunit 2